MRPSLFFEATAKFVLRSDDKLGLIFLSSCMSWQLHL